MHLSGSRLGALGNFVPNPFTICFALELGYLDGFKRLIIAISNNSSHYCLGWTKLLFINSSFNAGPFSSFFFLLKKTVSLLEFGGIKWRVLWSDNKKRFDLVDRLRGFQIKVGY